MLPLRLLASMWSVLYKPLLMIPGCNNKIDQDRGVANDVWDEEQRYGSNTSEH